MLELSFLRKRPHKSKVLDKAESFPSAVGHVAMPSQAGTYASNSADGLLLQRQRAPMPPWEWSELSLTLFKTDLKR